MPLATSLDLPIFQGPLDLLLSLIEKRRLDITEVSLVAVADQYLQAVRTLPAPDADVLAEFLDIATRLLLLKSRALLPRIDESDEETVDDLPQRLEEYRRFKDAALNLAEILDAGHAAYPHAARPNLLSFQPQLAPIEAKTLERIWLAILRRQPKDSVELASDAPRIQVAERVAYLRDLLARKTPLCWESLAGESLDAVIATFLALLELVRRGELHIRQDECFGPITLSPGSATIGSDRGALGS